MSTREKMVVGAHELVRRNGFGATSFRDVLEHTDTPRGSVYFHFPGGKEELGLSVVELQSATWLALIEQVASRTRTPATFVRMLAAELADDLQRNEYALGCAVQAVAVEMSVGSEALRTAAAAAYTTWIAAIEHALVAKSLTRSRARHVAPAVLAGLVGGMTVAKATRDVTALTEAGKLWAEIAAI